ncbi:MAG: OsmC family peroxiredoxin [Acidimicrobiia bacterium]|nr:OsmC family peroxiredoxin [Acidimicrobiia bacterium]
MTTEAPVAINGVDLEAVAGLVGAVKDDPAAGATTWHAEVRWTGGFSSEARVRSFAPVPSDEPPALGGGDTAANPVEQLLGALGNCLAVGYAANASAAGIVLDDVRVDLEGDLDLHAFLGLGDGNAGFESIRVQVHLASAAAPEALVELHERVVSTSPVGHTLQRAVPVTVELA